MAILTQILGFISHRGRMIWLGFMDVLMAGFTSSFHGSCFPTPPGVPMSLKPERSFGFSRNKTGADIGGWPSLLPAGLAGTSTFLGIIISSPRQTPRTTGL